MIYGQFYIAVTTFHSFLDCIISIEHTKWISISVENSAGGDISSGVFSG